jgi:hypothetical protein
VLNRLRLVPAGLVAVAATLFTAGTAHASLLTTTAQSCASAPVSQAFLPWGDPSQYFLAPGGNFATAAANWSLSGGATPVAGGDGYSLGGNPASTQSLSLPDTSSATSAPICVGIGDPTVRFFARNTGAPSATLLVSATVSTTLGLNLTLPIADISGNSTWTPSSVVPMVENLLPLLPGNMTPITLTFTPQGQGGAWQVDDLYVDPWQRGGGG